MQAGAFEDLVTPPERAAAYDPARTAVVDAACALMDGSALLLTPDR